MRSVNWLELDEMQLAESIRLTSSQVLLEA